VSDQPDAETYTWRHTTLTTDRHPCPLRESSPPIPKSERLQNHAFDRAATGTGKIIPLFSVILKESDVALSTPSVRARGLAPLILNLGTRCRQVVSFTPGLHYPWKEATVPIEREAGWLLQTIWTVWRRNNPFPLPEESCRNFIPWNSVKCQLDATRWFSWCILSSTCFGYIRPSSGALDVELQRTVFCTEFLDAWWAWEPLRGWNANLMQLGNFIDVFLARHVSGKNAHHQEHYMLSWSIWFLAPSLWMGGGLESRCLGRVYGADGDSPAPHHRYRIHESHGTILTLLTTHAAALKTTTHPKTRCRKPYAATQHLMLLMMGACTRNMSS